MVLPKLRVVRNQIRSRSWGLALHGSDNSNTGIADRIPTWLKDYTARIPTTVLVASR